MSLKEKLLVLGIVSDNEYLDKYVELIESNRDTKKEKFKTQRHHIIPKGYYRHNQLHIDESNENIVYLTHRNHALAHYYLIQCASVKWFKCSCLNAIIKMIRDFTNNKSTNYYLNNEEALKDILDKYDIIVEEANKLKSELYKGRVFINDGVITTTIDRKYLNDYLSHGWQIGKLYQMSDETKEKLRQANLGKHHTTSEETKRKIGEANKISLKGKKHSKERCEFARKRSLGRTWYNNGIKNIFISKDQKPPKDFIKGMILTNITKKEWVTKVHKGRTSEDYNTTGGTIVINNGKINKHIQKNELESYLIDGWKEGKLPLGKLNWYNNGIKNTRAYSCPEGYVEGRLLTDEVRYSLGKGSRNRFKKG